MSEGTRLLNEFYKIVKDESSEGDFDSQSLIEEA